MYSFIVLIVVQCVLSLLLLRWMRQDNEELTRRIEISDHYASKLEDRVFELEAKVNKYQ